MAIVKNLRIRRAEKQYNGVYSFVRGRHIYAITFGDSKELSRYFTMTGIDLDETLLNDEVRVADSLDEDVFVLEIIY